MTKDVELWHLWWAAVGRPEGLVNRLRSEKLLSPIEREALALLLEGKLVPPKRPRGRPEMNHGTGFLAALTGNTRALAAAKFNQLRRAEAASGSPRSREEVLEQVAEQYKLNRDSLDYYIRRWPKLRRRSLRPRKPPADLVEQFIAWCHEWGYWSK